MNITYPEILASWIAEDEAALEKCTITSGALCLCEGCRAEAREERENITRCYPHISARPPLLCSDEHVPQIGEPTDPRVRTITLMVTVSVLAEGVDDDVATGDAASEVECTLKAAGLDADVRPVAFVPPTRGGVR